MKYHGICNRVFQKNTLNTIADDTNSAGDKIHPNVYVQLTNSRANHEEVGMILVYT